jgi:hypothetical protein
MIKARLSQYVRLNGDQTFTADLPMYYEPPMFGVACTIDLMICQAGGGNRCGRPPVAGINDNKPGAA